MNCRMVLQLAFLVCATLLLLCDTAIAQHVHPDDRTNKEDQKTPNSMPRPGSQTPHSGHGPPGAQHGPQEMTGMQHHEMGMQPKSFVENILHHSSSGTSAEPNSTPSPMLMTSVGSWTVMFHGTAWLNELQQSGPRGFDKFFSTNWLMPIAQRQLGPGQLLFRSRSSAQSAK